jgi:hypothetical protein
MERSHFEDLDAGQMALLKLILWCTVILLLNNVIMTLRNAGIDLQVLKVSQTRRRMSIKQKTTFMKMAVF